MTDNTVQLINFDLSACLLASQSLSILNASRDCGLSGFRVPFLARGAWETETAVKSTSNLESKMTQPRKIWELRITTSMSFYMITMH